MIGSLTLAQLHNAFGGKVYDPNLPGQQLEPAATQAQPTDRELTFNAVSTDTRAIEAGDLFVALRGDNYDAHQFLADAATAGACALVVETIDPQVALPQWQVSDTVVALGQISALGRQRFHGPLIAITGSGGKTTVKGMVASILNHCGPTLATRGNFNNHIGVPLTLMGLEEKHEFAVIEMGASAGGEIAYLVQMAQPDVALVNNVMPAHVEGFGSVDGIAKAKGEIYQGLNVLGTAVLNLDEPYAEGWREQLSCQQVLSFSTRNPAADFYGKLLNVDDRQQSRARDPSGTSSLNQKGTSSRGVQFELITAAGSNVVTLPLIGTHNINNALAAAACATAAGAPMDAVVAGLEAFRGESGRLQLRAGLSGAAIIDDTYNANPGSVRAAIDALVSFPGRRTLVLGDLGELGSDAENLHAELGEYARQAGVERVITVGALSRHVSRTFGVGAQHVAEHEEACKILQTELDAESVVLVKGSRSARMERVVQAIVERGDKAQC